MRSWQRGNRSGFSLIEVVVVLGVLATLGYIATRSTTSLLNSVKQVTVIKEREDLKNLIRMRIDCNETKSHMISSSDDIKLYDRNGNVILDLNPGTEGGMKLGEWRIRVKKYVTSDGTFQIDGWKSGNKVPHDLFHPVPLTCG